MHVGNGWVRGSEKGKVVFVHPVQLGVVANPYKLVAHVMCKMFDSSSHTMTSRFTAHVHLIGRVQCVQQLTIDVCTTIGVVRHSGCYSRILLRPWIATGLVE
jgi:hypothetical protein